MVGDYNPRNAKRNQLKGSPEIKIPYKGYKGSQLVALGFVNGDIVTFPKNMVRMINMHTADVTGLLVNPVEDDNYYKVNLKAGDNNKNSDWCYRNLNKSSATNWDHEDVYYQEAR